MVGGHIRNYLNPYFGNMQINRVNFDAIEKFMNYARKKERLIGSKKKGRKQIKKNDDHSWTDNEICNPKTVH